MLHRIWQRQGMLPSDVMKLSKGERAFLFASEMIMMEQMHRPAGKEES